MSNDGNNTCRDGSQQEVIEGGQQPALGMDSSTISTDPTSVDQGVGKVFDLESFSDFVRKMAVRVQNDALSRDDALEMIAYVAKYRKLNDTYGEGEVCAVINNDFLRVVDPPDDHAEAEIEAASFPGVIGADQLQVMKYEPVTLVIPPLIAEGVTLLAGKPKLGKSWLMLDIALGIASGTPALGNLPTLQGEVLGLFLEDSRRRLQSRN